MKMKYVWMATGLTVALILSGCTTKHNPYPIAEYPETQYQLKIQAAAQWQALAQHQAIALTEKLAKGSALYISAPKYTSPFGRAYGKLLKSALVSNGFLVTNNARSDSQFVSYQTQVIQYKDRDKLKSAIGVATGASVGYVIANNITQAGRQVAAVVSIAAYDYLQWADSTGPTPDVEILMTTDVDQGDRKIYSNTSIYYLNAGDIGLYKSIYIPPEKTLNITDHN